MTLSTAVSAQGTSLQIQTTAAGAKAITAVQVGFPTIFTGGVGLSNGDIVTLAGFTGTDAALLNGLTSVVENVTGTTFALEINTLGKTIAGAAATATPFQWQAIGNMKSVSGFDGKPSEIDTTHLLSTAKEKVTGLIDYGNLQIECDQNNADQGQAKVYNAYTLSAVKNYKLSLPDGSAATFSAYVTQFSTTLGVDQTVKRTIGLAITGPVSWA